MSLRAWFTEDWYGYASGLGLWSYGDESIQALCKPSLQCAEFGILGSGFRGISYGSFGHVISPTVFLRTYNSFPGILLEFSFCGHIPTIFVTYL